jgi:hypothetical protein
MKIGIFHDIFVFSGKLHYMFKDKVYSIDDIFLSCGIAQNLMIFIEMT